MTWWAAGDAAQVLDCIVRQGVREQGEGARIEAGLPGVGEAVRGNLPQNASVSI